jgi:hypothetical protein
LNVAPAEHWSSVVLNEPPVEQLAVIWQTPFALSFVVPAGQLSPKASWHLSALVLRTPPELQVAPAWHTS